MIKSTAIDPTVLDADGVYRLTGPAQRIPHRAGRDRRNQGEPHPCRRCAGADLPRADGRRDGGDLSAHRRLAVPAVRQAGGGGHRRAFQRRVDRRVHRSCLARSARRRTDRQAARRRPDRDRGRSRERWKARSTSSASPVRRSDAEGGSRILERRGLRPDLAPDPHCPTTRASGRPCRTSAAARGAGRSTTRSRSSG